MSCYSATAFTHWLERYFSEEIRVVCDTSQMKLKVDAKPFNSKRGCLNSEEVEKKQTIEMMYRYYNQILSDQGKERALSRFYLKSSGGTSSELVVKQSFDQLQKSYSYIYAAAAANSSPSFKDSLPLDILKSCEKPQKVSALPLTEENLLKFSRDRSGDELD